MSKQEELKAITKEAKRCLRAGDHAHAIELLQQAVSLDSDRADVHEALAAAYFRERKYERAIEHFTAVLRLNPSVAMSSSTFSQAEGYADLGLHERAWHTLEQLPPSARTKSPVLELRLRILTSMERWQLGESIARVLASAKVDCDKCLETVARFHHAYAPHLSLAGDGTASREQIRAAVAACASPGTGEL